MATANRSTSRRPTGGDPRNPTATGAGAQVTAPVAALGTILSIWAHPDDETYLAGGIMATARDLGQRVVCASATAGEHGTGDPGAWPPARLGRVRRWEAAAAMAVLGVTEHGILGLPDDGLADRGDEGSAWVERLLGDVVPDTILTFGPDGMTHHADHIAVHRWVTGAWERLGRRPRLLFATSTSEHLDRFGDHYDRWDVYMTDERPAGVPAGDLALHLRLDGQLLDRKLTALRAMATQTGPAAAVLGPGAFADLVAEECFVDVGHGPRQGSAADTDAAGDGTRTAAPPP